MWPTEGCQTWEVVWRWEIGTVILHVEMPQLRPLDQCHSRIAVDLHVVSPLLLYSTQSSYSINQVNSSNRWKKNPWAVMLPVPWACWNFWQKIIGQIAGFLYLPIYGTTYSVNQPVAWLPPCGPTVLFRFSSHFWSSVKNLDIEERMSRMHTFIHDFFLEKHENRPIQNSVEWIG